MQNLSYLACLVVATCLQLSGAVLLITTEVCYEQVGCFSTGPPFGGPLRPIELLPQPPEYIKTRFILYTRDSQDPQYLEAVNSKNALAILTNFRLRRTIFIIHGFLDNIITKLWMKKMTDELLKHGDYNVFIVDWSGGNWFPYTQATANTRVVGAQVAYMVNHLIETTNITAGNVHIIGHSLGAQTAGYAGERIPNLDRISGLDPAGPFYDKTHKKVRLDSTDALFVDTIHTDMPFGLKFSLGTSDPSGHANFYPNGGHDQPGCGQISSTIQALINSVDEKVTCSHIRAHNLFIESINSACPFTAYQCTNEADFNAKLCLSCGKERCAPMGFHADKKKPPHGQIISYYLITNDDPPFCINTTAAGDNSLTGGLLNIIL